MEILIVSEMMEILAGLPLAIGGALDFLFGSPPKQNKWQRKASKHAFRWAHKNLPEDPTWQGQEFQDWVDEQRNAGTDFAKDWDDHRATLDSKLNPMMVNADDIIGKYGNLGYELGDFGTYGDSEINKYITDASQAQQKYLTDQSNARFNQNAAGLGALGLGSSSAMNKMALANQRQLGEDSNRYQTQANLEGLGMWLGDKNRHYDRLTGLQGAKMGHAFNTAYGNRAADLQAQMYDKGQKLGGLSHRIGLQAGIWDDRQNKQYMDYHRPMQVMMGIAGQPTTIEPRRPGLFEKFLGAGATMAGYGQGPVYDLGKKAINAIGNF